VILGRDELAKLVVRRWRVGDFREVVGREVVRRRNERIVYCGGTEGSGFQGSRVV
jgi:hypothetical protein